MMRLKLNTCSGMVLIALATASMSLTIPTVAAQEVTSAERTLFLDKHFEKTGKSTLTYLFHQKKGDGAAFDDKATVQVYERHPDGSASVATQFLSDEHAFPVPPLERATGNPVILGFLEKDIAKMNRLTGGSTNYFRKQIRMALAQPNVDSRTIQVDYGGHTVAAQALAITPYSAEAQRERLGHYAEKAYVFVTSTDVPGVVYCLYTKMNAPTDAAADSSIRIEGSDPKQCR